MAGYSGNPLIKKLGIKEDTKLYLRNAPGDYNELLGVNIKNQLALKIGEADMVHLFATNQKVLEQEFNTIIGEAKQGLVVWISWYKKSSGIKTDITEDAIREIVLPKGWVDVKVCAVSDAWSGLKIVKRKNNK